MYKITVPDKDAHYLSDLIGSHSHGFNEGDKLAEFLRKHDWLHNRTYLKVCNSPCKQYLILKNPLFPHRWWVNVL